MTQDNFLQLHTDILSAPSLSLYGKYLYIYILRHIDSTGYCRRSYRAMATDTGISFSHIKESIKSLVSLGFIKKVTSLRECGCHDVNRYYTADKPDLFKMNPEERKEYLESLAGSIEKSGTQTSPAGFISVSYGLIDNTELSIKEKMTYICLALFRNRQTGFCFPALRTLAAKLSVCVTTAGRYIKQLILHGAVKKRSYYNASTGARSSCRYQLFDVKAKKDAPPASVPADETQHTPDKKKKSKRLKMPDVAFSLDDTGTWTDETIRAYYNYNELLDAAEDAGIKESEIDYVLDIIRHNLNSSDEYFTYKGEKLPMILLKGAYEKLNAYNIIYAINKFKEQTGKIKNPESYIRILLYKAPYQEDIEIANDIKHDLYG